MRSGKLTLVMVLQLEQRLGTYEVKPRQDVHMLGGSAVTNVSHARWLGFDRLESSDERVFMTMPERNSLTPELGSSSCPRESRMPAMLASSSSSVCSSSHLVMMISSITTSAKGAYLDRPM